MSKNRNRHKTKNKNKGKTIASNTLGDFLQASGIDVKKLKTQFSKNEKTKTNKEAI